MKRFLCVLSILVILVLFISACTEKAPEGPKSVTANGVRINYVEKGKGDEVIVLIHGYSGALGNWKYLLELLPEEFHAYALDLRGFGQSEKPGSYKLEEIIEDIYAFSQELGIEQFTYVGHSLGGKIGYKFALDHPDVLKAMFLIAPSPAHDFIPSEQQHAFIDQITSVFGSEEALRGFIAEDFAKPPSEEDLNEFINDVLEADPSAKEQCAQWWISANLEPQLWNISIPTYIVIGEKDRLPLDWEKRYASSIKGCRFEVLEDAGHMAPYDIPERLVDLLTSFIKEVSKE